MNTTVIEISSRGGRLTEAEEELLRGAGDILKSGGLVAFPTETVYGLGGDALNPEASRKIYEAKGRPSDNPLIVHIAKFEDIYYIADEVTKEAEMLAEAFWPGPLTMILKKSDKVPHETTGGLETVAVRMPSNLAARRLIEYGGGYVAAPSANISGRPSPTLAKYVIQDMFGKIDAIIDGGRGEIGLESTIIDLTASPPQILRPGYITAEMLSAVLNTGVVNDTVDSGDESGKAPRAPGMKYRHYAPKGELSIVEGEPDRVAEYINAAVIKARHAGDKVGIIATDEQKHKYDADVIKSLGSRNDEDSVGKHLYEVLREFDDENVTKIFSESFDADGFGQAIMNRLLKAAGHRVIKLV
ncbi:MAG: threonylcarbamoyl-AMP synthase [Lachnospiraceae bacterium]|nr:threonylcarbamoyl-AMP synthase [Lachnospiraceae bacterium]